MSEAKIRRDCTTVRPPAIEGWIIGQEKKDLIQSKLENFWFDRYDTQLFYLPTSSMIILHSLELRWLKKSKWVGLILSWIFCFIFKWKICSADCNLISSMIQSGKAYYELMVRSVEKKIADCYKQSVIF